MAASPVWADEIEVQHLALKSTDRGLALDADFALELGPRLVEMVSSGIPVYFVVEFELTRYRWYWFDENTVSRRLQLRLSYHVLSRQYRLSTGLLQQSFSSLEEALHVLTRVRNWLVVERTVRLARTDYEAAVRIRLDAALLPKPFQLSALTSRELQLESAWKRFTVRSPRHAPAPMESRESEGGG
ncbi:MAG TPA: DUF4390 domain-containing protein [Burkholderiales bacterium]|nr:DUF4390 domain-containing protein [Burkholderiales bacterium]